MNEATEVLLWLIGIALLCMIAGALVAVILIQWGWVRV